MDLLAVIGWPVIDRIGPVSPHGLGIALGYLGGSWWMLREGRKRGLSEDHVGTILLWALVGAIVGARFFYVIGHLEDFESFVDMLKIWEGGISLIGGIAGAVIFAYPVMRKYGYRFLQVMDSAAVGLAFGIFVGRIGDLVIGDHLGKPTLFPGGWAYRGGELPGPWTGTEETGWLAPLEGGLVQQLTRDGATLCEATPDGFGCLRPIAEGPGVHQTALYDFVIALGLFFLLRWLSKRPRREGVMITTFAILYGTGRLLTDFLRVDKTYFGLTGSQLTAIAIIVVSLITLYRYWRNPLAEGAGEVPGEPEPVPAGAPQRSSTDFTPPEEPGEASAPDLPTDAGGSLPDDRPAGQPPPERPPPDQDRF